MNLARAGASIWLITKRDVNLPTMASGSCCSEERPDLIVCGTVSYYKMKQKIGLNYSFTICEG